MEITADEKVGGEKSRHISFPVAAFLVPGGPSSSVALGTLFPLPAHDSPLLLESESLSISYLFL